MAVKSLCFFAVYAGCIQFAFCQSKTNGAKNLPKTDREADSIISLIEHNRVLIVLNGELTHSSIKINKEIDTNGRVIIAGEAPNKLTKPAPYDMPINYYDITYLSMISDTSARTLWGDAGANGAVMINTVSHKRYLKNTYVSADRKDTLTPVGKAVFDNGTEFNTLKYYDEHVKKTDGKIFVSKDCPGFKDKTGFGHDEKYEYTGDIEKTLRYKVIQETTFDGDGYFVIDTKNNCTPTHLLGQPHIYGTMMVNINESQTTDKKILIEMWAIGTDGIKKLRTVDIEQIAPSAGHNIEPQELKTSDAGALLFKDNDGGYWQLNIMLHDLTN